MSISGGQSDFTLLLQTGLSTARMGFSMHVDLSILSWTELNQTELNWTGEHVLHASAGGGRFDFTLLLQTGWSTARMGFSMHVDLSILSWTELNQTELNWTGEHVLHASVGGGRFDFTLLLQLGHAVGDVQLLLLHLAGHPDGLPSWADRSGPVLQVWDKRLLVLPSKKHRGMLEKKN